MAVLQWCEAAYFTTVYVPSCLCYKSGFDKLYFSQIPVMEVEDNTMEIFSFSVRI